MEYLYTHHEAIFDDIELNIYTLVKHMINTLVTDPLYIACMEKISI